jgi:hypothetical protein
MAGEEMMTNNCPVCGFSIKDHDPRAMVECTNAAEALARWDANPMRQSTRKPKRHEYKTVRSLEYLPPRGTGDAMTSTCEQLEDDGWEVVSASFGARQEYYCTQEFTIVARRPKK